MANDEDVRRWIDAGLIDTNTAERILAFEAERARPREGEMGRPAVPELLIYLAAAITAAGMTVLTSTNWEHLGTAARVAIPTAASAATFALGLWLRKLPNPAMARAASLLWLLAGALLVGATAIAAAEAGGSEGSVALVSGSVALLASIALWNFMRMHPQIVGLGGAAFLFSTAVSTYATEDWVVGTLGVMLAAFGLTALVAAESTILVPSASARLLAGTATAFGGFYAGMPPTPPFMMVVTVTAIVVLLGAGIRFGSLIYVAFGVLTAFAGMLTLILRYVDSPTLAGLSLVAIGLLIMLAIVGLGRTQPWTRWHGARSDAGAP